MCPFAPRAIPTERAHPRAREPLQIQRLTLRHFRNIAALDWEPAPGLNLIWGDNGQGKTNLLEAVHMALTGRSFRTRREEQCLPWDQAEDPADPTCAHLRLSGPLGERTVRLLMGKGWKRAWADGQWISRLADLWSRAAVVTFTPADSDLLKGPPGERRRFLDMILSQTSRPYLEALQRYQQALRQVNAIFKNTHAPAATLRQAAFAYYPVLAQAGALIMQTRAGQLAGAGPAAAVRFAALGGTAPFELHYEPDLKSGPQPEAPLPSAQEYQARLEARFEDHRRQGHCSLGVHRDDFYVLLGGKDLRQFGSQGQHRLSALTLKLEAAGWIGRAAGQAPLLLLDDFGSELDPGRRLSVLQELKGNMQVLVTATDPADLAGAGLFEGLARVHEGRLA